jgi:beta-glucanase (GH16 family)
LSIDPRNLAATAKLTFADEFDAFRRWDGRAGWDTAGGPQWAGRVNAAGTLPYNNELQWYVDPAGAAEAGRPALPNPFGVVDGVLHVTARPADPALRPTIGGQSYTSGIITTEHAFSQTYGYFEIRAEVPAGRGLWPAFWLLPTDGSWPPELDVMEVLGHDTSTLHTTVHSRVAGTRPSWVGHFESTAATTVPDTASDFHTYGALWGPDRIAWYFDGREVFSAATPPDMNKPMYMVANLAVGGDWPGRPDASTSFPATLKIDYIRAYAEAPAAPPPRPEPAHLNPVYRFYDTRTGDHFYTLDVGEKEWILRTLYTYKYEGVAWATPDKGSGTVDVYRFYDRTDGSHVFTTSVAERDWIRATLTDHVDEGVAFQAYDDRAGEGRLTLTASSTPRKACIITRPAKARRPGSRPAAQAPTGRRRAKPSRSMPRRGTCCCSESPDRGTRTLARPQPAFEGAFACSSGGPRKAGTMMKAARRVKNRDTVSSLPMLAVPGWCDSHRLPNATPVVRDEKKIARVRLDASMSTTPSRQAIM